MGRAPCCDKATVRRGPWSPQEDATLRDYLEKHGNGGNWISLPYKAGLKRCGKSCRLRWLNYLRPDIKHGGFTEEEDTIICTLYSSLGSRWSVIASHLPGRTDNDVKNYWNTKLKKKLLAGRIHSTGSYPKSSGNHNIINSDDATTNIASVSNVPHFSISDQEVDRQNCLDANSCILAPLAELGYNQYYDTQGMILSNNTQSPLSDTVLTEFPTSGSSELKCQSFLSSQEASSWMKMESQCASWSISGSAVQDDQGILPDFGFEPAYELLNGFEFHENFSEVA